MGIWPPPYQIHLDHSEEFVIFENFGDEDSDRILSEDDEMIKRPDIRSLDFSKDSAKYLRIHKLAMKLGKRSATTEPAARKIKWPEENYDQEENQPWIAGYFAENGTNILSVITTKIIVKPSASFRYFKFCRIILMYTI